MCLSIVDQVYDPPLAEEREAWGVFRGGKTVDYSCPVEVGGWMRSSDGELASRGTAHPDTPYERGFHKFQDELHAKLWLCGGADYVRRVKLRGITAVGEQWPGAKVVVAKEMYVYPEEQAT